MEYEKWLEKYGEEYDRTRELYKKQVELYKRGLISYEELEILEDKIIDLQAKSGI